MATVYVIRIRCNCCGEVVDVHRGLTSEQARLLEKIGIDVTAESDWDFSMMTLAASSISGAIR